VVVLDTPSSLTLASDGAIAQYAGEHLSQVAQGDVQVSAAHTAAQVSGQTTSLFTHAGGLQMKAANGPVSLRAHADTLQLLANKDIQIVSVNSEITVSANSKIELIGADSGITLEGGDITFTTPGTWNAKGSLKELVGGASGSAQRPALPDSRVKLYSEQFRAIDKTSGKPIADQSYRLVLADGSEIRGKTDKDGLTQRVSSAQKESVKLYWDTDTPMAEEQSNNTVEGC
jgi:type VI secretion system secreted protein VgrG